MIMEDSFLQKKDLLISEHEAMRRAILLKHRKFSTQLKLETLHRQLNNRNPNTADGGGADGFSLEIAELSSEMEKINTNLVRAEKEAIIARRQTFQKSGLDCLAFDRLLSASQPTSTEELNIHRFSRTPHQNRAFELFLTPSLKRKFLVGKLRTVASLSSLSNSTASVPHDEFQSSLKDRRIFRNSLKAIGDFVDSHIFRRISSTNRKTKSADNLCRIEADPALLRDTKSTSTSIHRMVREVSPSEVPPLMSKSHKVIENQNLTRPGQTPRTQQTVVQEVDPKILAEIEEFEKMAARFIQNHSKQSPA